MGVYDLKCMVCLSGKINMAQCAHTNLWKMVFGCGLLFFMASLLNAADGIADPGQYLQEVKKELQQLWPGNRNIHLVFHGHSVPAGYFKTPVVNTLESYPYQVLKQVKALYPYAVVNVITTAIGGENAISGEKRFESEVLVHKPDVLFIDYALNDVAAGLDRSRTAWERMIRKALKRKIKIILMTPSPDQRVPILDSTTGLARHVQQIRSLAEQYGIGLADVYERFQEKVAAGDSLSRYMSQVNHPNEAGHALIAKEIMRYLTPYETPPRD